MSQKRSGIILYLDESGDLGFTEGKSSQHLVISFIATNDEVALKRAIKKIKIKYGISIKEEIKGSKSRTSLCEAVLKKIGILDLQIHTIVMDKSGVRERLKKDENVLYNFEAGLILTPFILNQEKPVKLVVDKRTIKITSGFRFKEFLRYRVWFEGNKDIDLDVHEMESHLAYGLQAVDVVCNAIFKKYERNDSSLYDLIKGKVVEEKTLFFK